MKELLRQRLASVQEAKNQLVGQLNSLIGREAELLELLELVEKEDGYSAICGEPVGWTGSESQESPESRV